VTYRTVNGCRYFYRDTGPPAGRPEADTVVFGHGFLMTHRLFENQIDALQSRYRCVAFDWRGQGRSQVTRGGYGLWDLASDAAALIEGLDLASCHYVGHSMGGYVGFRLALARAGLLKSLALLDTQARAEPWAVRWQYYLMLAAVRLLGYRRFVTERVLPIMFGPDFLENPAQRGALERWRCIVTANDRRGIFRTGLRTFSRGDVSGRLGQIVLPTLLLVGEHDRATPPSTLRDVHARMPHARFTVIPESGHSAPIERPGAVTGVLSDFLERHAAAPAT
jgi:pimeloyl-ACP methyl ester carboxylesterase